MIRTRVGYAGGLKDNPSYGDMGDHSETVQIDYDPAKISYGELLKVFWRANTSVNSPFSRQYHSIIFYHNEEQKELALKSYEQEMLRDKNTIPTEIVPYTHFYQAETYHQKYYLQNTPELIEDLKAAYASFKDLVQSTTAARVNGYIGGYGEQEILEKEIDSYGLSEDGKEKLLGITGRGLLPGCPFP